MDTRVWRQLIPQDQEKDDATWLQSLNNDPTFF